MNNIDDVDLGISPKKPGTIITGVQKRALRENDSVVTIKLEQLISFNEVFFRIEANPICF
ncbi:hypothetical protein LZ578_02120 [Jeotgalibaca sp. MA1X17-3]|uniref:hypothetical protein n=1 Tax=Jeotgalibaca sp. MA1X17-3 TaxID=2908211 RepID=UPI001F309D8B|nr:hypothetical protein [Jeotgalibaca sp. MA1X17-3]UJF15964.1 hypothetical protein LZ578_02120 [Jeotgalibaca sp. MA1X17-3]